MSPKNPTCLGGWHSDSTFQDDNLTKAAEKGNARIEVHLALQ